MAPGGSSSSSLEKALPKHPTNKKPYPHSPAGSIQNPEGDVLSFTYEPLDVQEATKAVSSRWAGASVVFLGTTRDDRSAGTGEDAGQILRVSRLEYEAYTPLALKTVRAIVHKARTTATESWPPGNLTPEEAQRYHGELEDAASSAADTTKKPKSEKRKSGLHQKSHHADELSPQAQPPHRDAILKVVLINRLGPVEVGQSSILVAVSCPHRRRAFEVAEWLLEETKRVVPIWKREVRVIAGDSHGKVKEVIDDGSGWVGLTKAASQLEGAEDKREQEVQRAIEEEGAAPASETNHS